MRIQLGFLLLMSALLQSQTTRTATDPHSFGNPHEIAVKHAGLDLTVDFDKRVLHGHATLTLQRKIKSAKTLILDDKGLDVTRVEAASARGAFKETKFEVGEARESLGAPLRIHLPAAAARVRIHYATRPGATALQWLTPAQTAGKKKPYLFSQSQAAHARSWIPLQDSPGVRITYSATIRTPKDLVAVMSAAGNPQQPDGPGHGIFRFKMDVPIPSYLIALAVGDLAFRSLGPRAGVYDEPSLVDRDAKEFEDVEAMIKTVERLYGPYAWGRYDMLVLPPSSPYGGMENPRLTFLSPTIVAGDKSLVSVVSHELAHSWSGNTVTNATWSDFWLNEGFTTYIERRIVEAVYGKERADMEAQLGRQRLQELVKELPTPDQILHMDLGGREPDEAATELPYEKGALLLRLLEERAGRARFDAFLNKYFATYRFKSLTTADFLRFLDRELLTDPKLRKSVPREVVKQWVYEPGMPESAPAIRAEAFDRVQLAAEQWLAGSLKTDGLPAAKWSTPEWLHFLKALPRVVGTARMEELDARFKLTQTGNIEILLQWLLLAIKNDYRAADARLEDVFTTVGRRKIVKPLYQELARTENGRQRARKIFQRARDGYHPIVANELEKLLP